MPPPTPPVWTIRMVLTGRSGTNCCGPATGEPRHRHAVAGGGLGAARPGVGGVWDAGLASASTALAEVSATPLAGFDPRHHRGSPRHCPVLSDEAASRHPGRAASRWRPLRPGMRWRPGPPSPGPAWRGAARLFVGSLGCAPTRLPSLTAAAGRGRHRATTSSAGQAAPGSEFMAVTPAPESRSAPGVSTCRPGIWT